MNLYLSISTMAGEVVPLQQHYGPYGGGRRGGEELQTATIVAHTDRQTERVGPSSAIEKMRFFSQLFCSKCVLLHI